ncbi:uncharacterized protein DS421_1g15680 [Arachis hypogaea]|nr:uncharacterized protein DS421_1g15680 [Arachis hypogaea]
MKAGPLTWDLCQEASEDENDGPSYLGKRKMKTTRGRGSSGSTEDLGTAAAMKG